MYKIPISHLKFNRLNKIGWILASNIVNENVWLAGGAMRTLIDSEDKIVDYDLYFKSLYANETRIDNWVYEEKKILEEAKDKLTRLGFKLIYECPEGKLFTYELNTTRFKTNDVFFNENKHQRKVQLICEQFYSRPEDVINTFDLSACRLITDGRNVWTDRETVRSINKKELHINRLDHPVSTFKRIIKYEKKGYQVTECIEEYIEHLGNLIESEGIQVLKDKQVMRRYID